MAMYGAVFLALAINGTFLMALLMQGCGQSKEPAAPTETAATNQPPAFVETTNTPAPTSAPPAAVSAPIVPEPVAPPVVPAVVTEYTIARGDILEKVAKNAHVSVKAIIDANPGIEPTKLKIGQKIHIPAAATPASPTAAIGSATETPSAGGEQTYSVKSGDNLTKIATQHGISVKALRAANALKTDSIKVGQKLKIPAKTASASTATSTPVEPAPASTTPPTSATPPGK